MAVQVIPAALTKLGGLERLRELKASIQGTAATLRLYRSDFAPGANATEADMEAHEVDFDTYAPAALTYGVTGLDGLGRPFLQSNDVFFQNVAGTAATPGGDSIGGAWIRTHQVGPPAVDAPVQFFPFGAPLILGEPLSALTIDVVQVEPDDESYAIVEV